MSDWQGWAGSGSGGVLYLTANQQGCILFEALCVWGGGGEAGQNHVNIGNKIRKSVCLHESVTVPPYRSRAEGTAAPVPPAPVGSRSCFQRTEQSLGRNALPDVENRFITWMQFLLSCPLCVHYAGVGKSIPKQQCERFSAEKAEGSRCL